MNECELSNKQVLATVIIARSHTFTFKYINILYFNRALRTKSAANTANDTRVLFSSVENVFKLNGLYAENAF